MEALSFVEAWPDRYRPTDLEGMALAPDLRERFQRYLAGNALPRSIILHGPPGFGKTTIANIIAEKLYSPLRLRVMRVKATETGNVEYIRTRAIEFMRAMSFDGGPKLLIFEEASGLSHDAGEALRVPLEEWADVCRVIFLTNDLSKLDAAIQSRCDVIEMSRPPTAECARILGRILEAEGHTVEPATVQAFTRGHFVAGSDRDLRSLLASAQHWIETKGGLPAPLEPELSRSERLDEAWRGDYRAEDVKAGAQLLNSLATEFSKYLSLPTGGVETLALWTVFAWAHEAFSISPILTLVSPTMRAGKSTVFEMLEQLLIPETYHPSSMTAAVLYRLKGIAEPDQAAPPREPELPTLCLLMDEADNWLSLGKDLQGVLNSGWTRRSAFVLRAGRDGGKFSSWYPKALALVNRPGTPLPDTVRDRSIVIPMQRKSRAVQLPKFARHQPTPELSDLQQNVVPWVREHFAELRELGGGSFLAAEELHDRARDNWHPLMCIARAAGGDWEERARQASLSLSATTQDTELLVELLTDIKEVFDSEGTDALRTVVLVEKLKAFEASPWKESRLTPIKLSKMLRPVGIHPQQLWIEAGLGRKKNTQGYERAHFEDAFSRYLG